MEKVTYAHLDVSSTGAKPLILLHITDQSVKYLLSTAITHQYISSTFIYINTSILFTFEKLVNVKGSKVILHSSIVLCRWINRSISITVAKVDITAVIRILYSLHNSWYSTGNWTNVTKKLGKTWLSLRLCCVRSK